jgi:carboxymethylenebutenolidase
MPTYNPNRVEYEIVNSQMVIVMDGGGQFPAYWAHPHIGRRLPAVALIHDWWGLTPAIRHLANLFAQTGYYVVAPDLFGGQIANTPQEAMELVKTLGDAGFPRVDAALTVLENHNNTNSNVAAVGVGMGGSLAFEAAIVRKDLEAAVAYAGFPQRYLGRFKDARTPILAFYGDDEPHIPRAMIDRLQHELGAAKLSAAHQVVTIAGIGHDFFGDSLPMEQHEAARAALSQTFTFLDHHLQGPTSPKIKAHK